MAYVGDLNNGNDSINGLFDIGTSPERSEHPLKVGISYGPEMGDSPGMDVV